MNTENLYAALAAILNALEDAGEPVTPVGPRGFQMLDGKSASVDKENGRWVVASKE